MLKELGFKKLSTSYEGNNTYVYNRMAHSGKSFGLKAPKDFDQLHYNKFCREKNAKKKLKIMLKKYPNQTWITASGSQEAEKFIKLHGAGK